MAEGVDQNVDLQKDDRKLTDVYLEGWSILDELEETALPFSSTDFQDKLRTAIADFETCTRVVSHIQMFSANEQIEEVPTDCLQYLLLPFFLAKLTLKLTRRERGEVLKVADIYFKDFLERCRNYGLCEQSDEDTNNATPPESTPAATPQIDDQKKQLANLMRSAHARNLKISRFMRKKKLEEQVTLRKAAVRAGHVDDEVKREFYVNLIKKSVIETYEELTSLQLEQQIVEMRYTVTDRRPPGDGNVSNGNPHSALRHHHQHGVEAPQPPPPLRPFIITRNETQRAVFGLGYPSLPVMTVGEFYQQRVDEGIFPDEAKQAEINAQKAINDARDPESVEEEERAAVEAQIADDDPEYLARMRRMDEYKDVVRRGDGNRYNRS